MANTIYQPGQIKVKVRSDGTFQTTTPITLKNAVGGSAGAIGGLSDVSTNNISNSNILAFVSNTGQWTNRAPTLIVGESTQIKVTNTTAFDYNISFPDVVYANNIVVANAVTMANLAVGDVIVSGNLTVTGSTTYINTNEVNIGDNIIVLDSDIGEETNPPGNNLAGIRINRGALANVSFLWNESTQRWSFNGNNVDATEVIADEVTTALIDVATVSMLRGNTVVNGQFTVANTAALGNTTITGFVNVSTTANVGGIATFRANVVANGTLTVANTVAVGNTTVTGFINVSSTANVGGVANFRANVIANGTLTVANTVAVGNTTVNGTLTSNGITVNGSMNVSTLSVTNNANIGGVLTVTNTVSFNNTTVTGVANIVGNLSVSDTISGKDLVLTGNLTVNGTTTYINSTNLNVGDNTITLNADLLPAAAPTETAGIEINRGSQSNVSFLWDEAADRWTAGNVAFENTTLNGTANVTGVAEFKSNVVANGQLTVSNTASLGNTTVTGFVNISTTANIGGVANFRANVIANGTLTVANSIAVGNTEITGYVNVSTTANVGGVANFRANVVANGQLIVANVVSAGNTTVTGFINVSSTANVGGIANFRSDVVANGTLTVANTASLGNTTITGFANVSSDVIVGGNVSITGTITTTNTNANLVLDPNGTGIVVISNASGGAVGIELGSPTLGSLTSNAVTLTTNTSVSDGVAQLNRVLGKLVPPTPPQFPNGSITIATTSYRMTNFTQTDNTPSGRSVAGGSTVAVLRTSTATTSNVINSGPGDTGTVTAYLNNTASGSVTLSSTLTPNTTNGSLRFFNNLDYNTVNTSIAAGFWSVFSANGSLSAIPAGWNEFKIGHSSAGNTNTVAWYYDNSAPGAPTFSGTSLTVNSANLTYSSTVPHYNSSTTFNCSFYAGKLSGDTYPTTDTFATGTASGSFAAPASITYAAAGITTPLARNLYVASGNTGLITTTVAILSGFANSSLGPQITINNGYSTTANTFLPGKNVLRKTGLNNNVSTIEEANVYFGSTVGTGAGAASRIVNPGSTDTPAYTASATLFDSQAGPLQTYDATVVAGVLSHNQTDYSTVALPAGPNLSTGRTGAQYLTFKFVRTSLSKFDIRYSGTIAGLWVALPGSTLDSTSTLNGWLDCSLAYNNSGTPGANTAAGGNGTNGCGLSNLAVLNSVQTNKNVTATFGPVSSSSTATNEVYVRIKLTSGQTVTALSLQTASA